MQGHRAFHVARYSHEIRTFRPPDSKAMRAILHRCLARERAFTTEVKLRFVEAGLPNWNFSSATAFFSTPLPHG
jgi:hypothetical protein